jgi:hypothetical protein
VASPIDVSFRRRRLAVPAFALGLFGLLGLLACCRKDPTMTAPISNTPTAPAPVPGLGADFAALPFAPGRYVTAVQRSLQGTHELQVLVEDSTAVFVLELTADRTATACRGWRYDFRNDGPEIHTEERFRDQRGYRGRYTLDGEIAEVELRADDGACATIAESTYALTRAAVIKLRCVVAQPQQHAVLTGDAPVLVCQWGDASATEAAAHVVAGLAPEGWMVLGSGNGLAVKVTGAPVGAREGDEAGVTATPASKPLEATAWQRSF